MLTPLFGVVLVGFLLLVLAAFVVDSLVARRWPWLTSSFGLYADTEEKLVRVATGAFFLLLWDNGADMLWERGTAILTPELMATAQWIGILQFVIGLSMI